MLDINSIIEKAKILSLTQYLTSFQEANSSCKSRFRKFEALQSYGFLNESDYIAFKNNKKDFYSQLKKLYSDNLSASKNWSSKGLKKTRLRFIVEPLTDYLQYQQYTYAVWEKLGYGIVCFDDAKLLPLNVKDFIVFDNQIAYVLNFGDNGFNCAYEVSDKDDLESLINWYDATYDQSLDYRNFADWDNELKNQMITDGLANC